MDCTMGMRRKEQGVEGRQQHGQQVEYFESQYVPFLFEVSVAICSYTVAASNLYGCSEKWWWPEQTL